MSTIKEILQKMLEHPLEDGRAAKVHVAAVIMKEALSGDKTFMKILLDRVEGRPPVAVVEPVKVEEDHALAQALLTMFGEVTEEEALSVAAEAAEMEQIARQVRENGL